MYQEKLSNLNEVRLTICEIKLLVSGWPTVLIFFLAAIHVGGWVLAQDPALASVALGGNGHDLLGEKVSKVDDDGEPQGRRRKLVLGPECMRHLIAEREVRVEDLDVALGVGPGALVLVPETIHPTTRTENIALFSDVLPSSESKRQFA